MDDLDEAVTRAWALSIEDMTDAVHAAFDELVPILEAAGYAKTDGTTWHWTAAGITRAEQLTSQGPT